MSIEQMRAALSVQYEGDWADRVAKMSDKQVYATYMRLLNSNKIK